MRAAERRYGMRPGRIAPIDKVDEFLDDLKDGKSYPILAVGSSRIEAALHPDVFPRVFNLGLPGSSSIPMLEFLDGLHLRPERIIVGVSPVDLSPRRIERGEKHIAGRRRDIAPEGGLSGLAQKLTYGLIHAAAPDRRRSAGQWLKMRHDGGNLLGFLNNEAATGPVVEQDRHGYRPSFTIADAGHFTFIEWHTIPIDYVRHHTEPVARFVSIVRRFTGRGTTVTLVRIPTSATIRRDEDAESSFAQDAVLLARLCGVRYIDGATLVDDKFLADRNNFSDTEHLNDHGALLFSRALYGALVNGGRRPDEGTLSARW